MHNYSPTKRVRKRMLEYGALWGTIFGGVISVVLFLVSIDFNTIPESFPWNIFLVGFGVMVFFICGMFVGAIFGMAVGLFSGLAMSWITNGYGKPDNEMEYRIAVGLATALITILIFLPLIFVIPLIDIQPLLNNYVTALIGSIGVTVYASQRVATKYLQDIQFNIDV